MTAYRATRTEPRVSVGPWTQDLTKGQVIRLKGKSDPNRGFVPQEVADYLVDQGLLVEVDDDAVDNEWFDSDDPVLAGNEGFEARVAADAAERIQAAEGEDVDVEVNVSVKDAPAEKKGK